MSASKAVFLVGAGHAHPELELGSDELEESVPGMKPGWSMKHLGMGSRRVLGIGQQVNTLAVSALGDALDEAGWTGDTLDVIVSGTVFPDQAVPASASFLARAHSPSAVAFDVSAACASFIYALSTTIGLLQTDGYTRGAACSSEHPTVYVDYTDPRSCVFWGDAAGAVVVTTEQPTQPCFEVIGIALNGDHRCPEKVFVPRSGHFRSDGRFSFDRVVELGSSAVETLLARHRVDPEDLVGAVLHQASTNLITKLGSRIGVPFERQWHNYEWAGNQSAAGVVTAFSAGWKQHRTELRDGDHVVLAAVGGGYPGAAALLRWRSRPPSGS